MKKYLVQSKGDDYGACKLELIEASQEIAEQYYHHREVSHDDFVILAKYIYVVVPEEEAERSEDQRFYGN